MADPKSQHPDELKALAAEMEAAKAEHLADRGNPEKAKKAHDLMHQYSGERAAWREVGEANGTRFAGADVQNNVESNGA